MLGSNNTAVRHLLQFYGFSFLASPGVSLDRHRQLLFPSAVHEKTGTNAHRVHYWTGYWNAVANQTVDPFRDVGREAEPEPRYPR